MRRGQRPAVNRSLRRGWRCRGAGARGGWRYEIERGPESSTFLLFAGLSLVSLVIGKEPEEDIYPRGHNNMLQMLEVKTR